jgi:hypothetical protein
VALAAQMMWKGAWFDINAWLLDEIDADIERDMQAEEGNADTF